MVRTIISDRGLALIFVKYEYFTLPECRQCRPRLGPCPRLEGVYSYMCSRLSPYTRAHTRLIVRIYQSNFVALLLSPVYKSWLQCSYMLRIGFCRLPCRESRDIC